MIGVTEDDASPEATALLDAMHAHAEDMCAGWLIDMEFSLWSAVVKDGKYASSVSPSVVRNLRSLGAAADGWWVHSSTVNADWQTSGGRVFLPITEWETIYALGPQDSEAT